MKPAPSPAYYLPIPAAPSYSVPSPSAVPAYPGVPASSPPLPSPVSYPSVPASREPYPSPPDHKGIKEAYWPSFDEFEASSIDTSYFTHIFYAFLLPDPVTFKLNVTPFDQQKKPGRGSSWIRMLMELEHEL
jgi:chitinase